MFNRLVCHKSKQQRYFGTHRQGGFAVPVPGVVGKPTCLPSRDTGALSSTSLTAAAYSLHNHLSPVFVLEQFAPTLICNCQCLVRTPQSCLLLPLQPTRILPPVCSLPPLRTRDIVHSFHPKNLPSHIHTLQSSPRKLHLPKREMQPIPKIHLNSERPGQVPSYPSLC